MDSLPRLFHLFRAEDVSGVSGTGIIAEGVQFTDGTCVLRWLTDTASTQIYKTLAHVRRIHGHEGRTKVVWIQQ